MTFIFNWITLSLLAGTFQTIRNSLSKTASKNLSPIAVTFTRFFYAIPVVLLFLFLGNYFGLNLGKLTLSFFYTAVFGALGQIIGSAFLFYLIDKGGFNKGVMFSRTEVIFAAIFGALFFSQAISLFDWLGVFLATVGVFLIAIGRQNLTLVNFVSSMKDSKTLIGISSGFFMALATLFISVSTRSIQGGDNIMNSALSLLLIIIIQSVILSVYIFFKENSEIGRLLKTWKFDFFVGFFSALGSLCWFIAFSLQNVALVRVVGQIEILLTLLIAIFIFKEKLSFKELLGSFILLSGIVTLFI